MYKCCQNLQNSSSSVGMTKSRAFAYKCWQNISTSVGMTKSEAKCTNLVKTALFYSIVTIYLGLHPKNVILSWRINLWKEHSGHFYLYLPTYLLKSLSLFTIYIFNSIHYKAKFIKMLVFFSNNLITLCIDTITSLGSYLRS